MTAMTRMLPAGLPGRLSVAVAAFLAAAAGVQAAEMSGTGMRIGNWYAAAYTDDETGDFRHCAAAANYKNGIVLAFSVSGDMKWAMGLSDQRWQLAGGDSYPVRYRINREHVFDGTASVVNPTQVKIPLPGSDRLFERFRQGRTLTVYAADKTMDFSLTSTSRLLPALMGCARYWDDHTLGANSNPFASDSNPFGE